MDELVGVTLAKVEQSHDVLLFTLNDDRKFKFYHEQDCCESVAIDDVNGDWLGITGSPLLVAEERISTDDNDYGTETWTFYTFRTVKGSVDVKWHGESNGYYSERVSYNFV